MTICKVWDSEYPWDVRVEKICRSLVAAGHDVRLVCRNRRRQARREVRDGLRIERLPVLPGRLNGAASFPAFVNPLWIGAIACAARGAEVIVVRDLPLALAGIAVGRATGRRVVLDFAENYPAMLRDFWPSNRRQPLNWIVRNPGVARLVERVAIRLADRILVVVREARERLQRLGVPAERLALVMNTPLPERFVEAGERALAAEAANPWLDVVYLGFLDPARGVGVAVEAMEAIVARAPRARLVVIGSGADEARLRALAQARGVAGRVHFTGFLPYEQAHAWIEAAAVGIVPHPATESWSTTIPNKLFDYMALGKPVVVSDAPPTRRIVEAERCGLVFRAGDAGDFAAQVARLADPVLRREQGSRGRRAVLEHYNWGVDEKALLHAVEGRPADDGLAALTGARDR